ncbi:MAG: N-acetylmuramoyl-L-alanine amidase CwlD [Clostridioides sp.]|jgi:N-acetylmuramoyl-L-alanine amidase|nr:N-acetylmuramoyl-L-alanine amidase CwlD [Clostridioides sp.]
MDVYKHYIKYIVGMLAVIAIGFVLIVQIRNRSEETMKYTPVTNKTVILDAGHGGIDPGAMNKDQTILEKEVNLSITMKLRELIESSGGLVILTREDDSSLYEEGDKTIRQKYQENLNNRKKIIKESAADMFVSIHLNAFAQSQYFGAQTFYPEGKDDSKKLAKYVQDELKRVVDKTNNRVIKSKDDMYLLKDNEIPSMLIECGFLSNEKESKLLNDEEYQEKIAWAIFVGIQKYMGEDVSGN